MEAAKHHAEGLALALIVCGAVPGAIAAAAMSCQPVLDAAPWAAAIAAICGLARLARWAKC